MPQARRKKVLKLVPKPSFKEQARAETVALLKDWVEMAEKGKIVEVALVGLMPESVGDILTGSSPSNNVHKIIGGLERLKLRILIGEG